MADGESSRVPECRIAGTTRVGDPGRDRRVDFFDQRYLPEAETNMAR